MNLFRLIFELLVIYILYKLVFELIIPVAKTTRQIKRKMNEFQQQQQEQHSNRQETKPAPKADSGDYIDYEEVK